MKYLIAVRDIKIASEGIDFFRHLCVYVCVRVWLIS